MPILTSLHEFHYSRVCSNVDGFNNRNTFLTFKLLKQGYRYHKLRKAFFRIVVPTLELIGKKTLLQPGISDFEFFITVC